MDEAKGENVNEANEAWGWYVGVLKRYAEFDGRARRREFWMYFLVNLAIAIGLTLVSRMLGLFGFLRIIYSLATLVPSLAVGARRLHDTGKSGWWLLLGLIPVLGGIALLVMMAMEGEAGDNPYGPNPKLAANQVVQAQGAARPTT